MKMSSWRFVLVVATAVSLIGYPKPAIAATVDVTVGPGGNLIFSPDSVTIHPGDQVRWSFASAGHSTTSGSPGMPNGIWDSGIRPQGATFTRTFNSAGTFPYYCTPHGGCCAMVGTVTVDTASPTPAPTGTPGPSSTPPPTPPPALAGCSNFTTAEGCNALESLTTGAGNTGLGWRALFTDTTGNFNTSVGAGALVLNNSDSNTAVGAAALLLNTSGTQNTAVGTAALEFNDSGDSNTATGSFALMNNTTGGSNTAVGTQALQSSLTTSDHVALGTMAGSGITTANNNIIIGHHSGVHSVFGEESDRCFIDNISGAPVSAATAAFVMVDSDGRLGTVPSDGPNPGGFSPKGIRPQAIPDAAKQGMLNLQVQALEATIRQQQQQIGQQQQQIETLTAQLKEQIAQIQKVNAQLEMRKPSARMILNEPKALPSGKVHGQPEQ